MKKLSIAIILLFVFVFYSLYEARNKNIAITNSTTNTQNNTQHITTTGQYKSGTYLGDAADAYYGNVQVQATITNGKIADVQFLQYPHDQGESVEINTEAMPQLKQEAIQVQNAQVDIISGATQTSQAFRQSLQSALDKAKS